MKKLFAVLLAVAMMLSLACSAMAEAPAAIPEGRRVITFWHSMSGGNLDALNEIVADFNNSQDEIWVDASYQGAYDECLTKLKSAFTAASAPDVFMMFELGANYLANSGYVIPFQDRFDEEPFMDLNDIVDVLRIPVIAYGLRADFRGNLFEGSQWLLAWADSIEEIKTVCWCGKKATFNARVRNGKVVKAGDQIMLGGNESYTALCRKHWAEGKLGPDA